MCLHAYRESNRIADALAERARTMQEGVLESNTHPPNDLESILLDDAMVCVTDLSLRDSYGVIPLLLYKKKQNNN